jgi:hypothetical protein
MASLRLVCVKAVRLERADHCELFDLFARGFRDSH